MFNNETFEVLKTMPIFIFNHLNTAKYRIHSSLNFNTKEIDILKNFTLKIQKLGLNFEKSLFKETSLFQVEMRDHVRDDKVNQYYQLIVNSLLRYTDDIQGMFKGLVNGVKTLKENETIFKNAVQRVKTTLDADINKLDLKISTYLKSYETFVKRYDIENHEENKKKKNFEDTFEKSNHEAFEQLKASLFSNNNNILKHLRDTAEKEKEIKVKIKEACENIVTIIHPNKEEVAKKLTEIDKNIDKFKLYFQDLTDEMDLVFSNNLSAADSGLEFMSIDHFLTLDRLLDNSSSRLVFTRIKEKEKSLGTKVKIYIELICRKLYTEDEELSKVEMGELMTVISNPSTCDYFIHNLIHKKAVVLLKSPFANLFPSKAQVKNFLSISRYFLLISAERKRIDYETIYQFMKFCLTVFDSDKKNFLELLNKSVILHNCDFWMSLMNFFTKYPEFQKTIGDEIANTETGISMVFGLKSIIASFTNSQSGVTIHSLRKAFEETAFLIFKCRLDFEAINNILMFLAPKAGISFDSVKTLLRKNQDVFLKRISVGELLAMKWQRSINKQAKLTKLDTLIVLINSTLPFYDKAKDVFNLITLNKFIYGKRIHIFKAALATSSIRTMTFRKIAFQTYLSPSQPITSLNEKIKVSEVPNVIKLDVKRTNCEYASFDPKHLTLILYNISHKSMHNYQYYQGLNYLVCYFLSLYGKDVITTYNVSIGIIDRYMEEYTDQEFLKLQKLFFYAKRLMKIYLPQLANYLEHERKIALDMFLASWCLTIFTTILQGHKNVDLLHQIIEIFVGKGWPGFFQIILVILDELQEELFKLGFEEIILLMGDVAKNNFKDVIACHKKHYKEKEFNFKEKVRKFRHVDKNMLLYFKDEHENILGKINNFWLKISQRFQESEGKISKH